MESSPVNVLNSMPNLEGIKDGRLPIERHGPVAVVSAKNLATLDAFNGYQQQTIDVNPRPPKAGNKFDKNYADIRVKLGNKRQSNVMDDERDSLPSDLSDDMWGELPKFRYHQHKEQMRKDKQDKKLKREAVK